MQNIRQDPPFFIFGTDFASAIDRIGAAWYNKRGTLNWSGEAIKDSKCEYRHLRGCGCAGIVIMLSFFVLLLMGQQFFVSALERNTDPPFESSEVNHALHS